MFCLVYTIVLLLLLLFLLVLFFVKMWSHYISLTGLELIIQTRLASNCN